MVQGLSDGGVRDLRVLAALDATPSHLLIPEALREQAYSDAASRIGNAQTISAPITVATMTEALGLQGDETVLEVGTGSGYQTAILANFS